MLKFEDLKVKDIMADADLMAVIKEYIPDWEKYPVGLIKNKKVADVIKLALDKKLCTQQDVDDLTKKMNEVLSKKK